MVNATVAGVNRSSSVRPDCLRQPLQADKNRKQRNQGLEQINKRQAARLRRTFKDGRGMLRIRERHQHQHDCERQEKENRAEKVDERPGAGRRPRVEDIDADMTVDLKNGGSKARTPASGWSRGRRGTASPRRRIRQWPAGAEGWGEEKLASLVTRDSMIGTGFPKEPSEAA
jgi:hypothetical protein